jgi:hypothetical protein
MQKIAELGICRTSGTERGAAMGKVIGGMRIAPPDASDH